MSTYLLKLKLKQKHDNNLTKTCQCCFYYFSKINITRSTTCLEQETLAFNVAGNSYYFIFL
jgi:hypothetical protein